MPRKTTTELRKERMELRKYQLDCRKYYFDRWKDKRETLRTALRESHQYHRESLSMIFKVTATCGSIFVLMLGAFATAYGSDKEVVRRMSQWIAYSGLVVSIFCCMGQFLAIRGFNLYGKVYLRPLRLKLGLPKTKEGEPMNSRVKMEKQIASLLYSLYVIYFLSWLWILIHNHSLFNAPEKGVWI